MKDLDTHSGLWPADAWVLTDGKAGDIAQCIGVAEALGLPYQSRVVSPRAPFTWLMPSGPIDPRERETRTGSPIAPPFPGMVIASGRRAVPYLRRVHKLTEGRTFTVFLKDPRIGTRAADFIWVPEHDKLRGPNVLATLTSPHRFSRQRLEETARQQDPRIDTLKAPRIAVLVGGNSRHHTFTEEDCARFSAGLKAWSEQGLSLMITASRRTPSALQTSLEALARQESHFLWDGTGENPYPAFLAKADALVVTADSTNMVGEAAATGKPIHVFSPHGGHPKIDAFVGNLQALGIVHPFPGALQLTTYEPLDSTPVIATAIRNAISARNADHPEATVYGSGTGNK